MIKLAHKLQFDEVNNKLQIYNTAWENVAVGVPIVIPTKIIFLNQVANIGTTTIFTALQAGLYQIQIIGSTGTTGNRNITAQTITHTEAGIIRTKAVGNGINTASANNFGIVNQVFQCDAGTNINYANTMSGTTGTYNVRILITKLD